MARLIAIRVGMAIILTLERWGRVPMVLRTGARCACLWDRSLRGIFY
jgi:hypothetical protein